MKKIELQFEQIEGTGKYERDDAIQLIMQPAQGVTLTLNNAIEFTQARPFIEPINFDEICTTDYNYKISPPTGIVYITKKYIRE